MAKAGNEPYNASEVVALSDSRFLFCDNNVSDALFEFRLRRDGRLGGQIVRRRIEGLTQGAIDDIEGIEIVEAAGRTFIFGTSSLCLKTRKGQHPKKKRGKVVASRESIVRIAVGPDGRLRAEVIPGFRPWLIEQVPWLKRAAGLIPDDGGLNVEALSWDPRQKALLFGLRTPVIDGKPVVLRVKPRKIDGPWTLDNLQILPPLTLALPNGDGDAGIRAMSLDQSTGTLTHHPRQLHQSVEGPVQAIFVGWQPARDRPALRGCQVPSTHEGGRRDSWKGAGAAGGHLRRRWRRVSGVVG